jgi:hypothetical protein
MFTTLNTVWEEAGEWIWKLITDLHFDFSVNVGISSRRKYVPRKYIQYCGYCILFIYFFFDGATARGGLWPPLQYASKLLNPLLRLSIRPLSPSGIHYIPRLIVRFRNNSFFYGVKLLASCTTPNLEDQGIPFRLGRHLQPVQQGWPYQ